MEVAMALQRLITQGMEHICLLSGDGDFKKPLAVFKESRSFRRLSIISFGNCLSAELKGVATEVIQLDQWNLQLQYDPKTKSGTANTASASAPQPPVEPPQNPLVQYAYKTIMDLLRQISQVVLLVFVVFCGIVVRQLIFPVKM
jgi:hypothetical protein